MNFCRYCERELPGLEKVCKECFAARYDQVDLKPHTFSERLKAWRPVPPADESAAERNVWVKVLVHYWFFFLAGAIVLYFLSYVFLFFFATVLLAGRLYIFIDNTDHSARRSRPSLLELVLLLAMVAAILLRSRIGTLLESRIIAVVALLWFAYVFIERKRYQ